MRTSQTRLLAPPWKAALVFMRTSQTRLLAPPEAPYVTACDAVSAVAANVD
jgi:hypothetical protein